MSTPDTAVVTMNAASVQFVTDEILVVHALCDRALVPRLIESSLLSMSQRVAILEGCYVGLVARLGMDAPSASH